jgi:hypothetical protein
MASSRSGSIALSKPVTIHQKLLDGEKFLKWTDQVKSIYYMCKGGGARNKGSGYSDLHFTPKFHAIVSLKEF